MIKYIWDNDIETCDTPTTIGARQCKLNIPTLEEVNVFLNRFHFQGTCFGQDIRYGLYYKDTLISVMTFGKARFTNKAQYELLRLCYDSKYKVMGGSERLFKAFVSEHHPNSVISYCDNSKFTGDVYLALGMKKIQKGNPRKHFFRSSDNKHFTMQQVLKYGVDNLLKTSYGKGKNNEELLKKEGFEVILDEGQAAYLYLDEKQAFVYNNPEDISKRLKQKAERYSDYCKTEAGKQMCTNRNKKLVEFHKTKEGKISEQNRIDNLRKFYQTEEGKLAKQKQVLAYKEKMSTPEGKAKIQQRAKNYSVWASTPEGKAILKAGAKKTSAKLIENSRAKVNAMTDAEWAQYLKEHPRTTLKKYRLPKTS